MPDAPFFLLPHHGARQRVFYDASRGEWFNGAQLAACVAEFANRLQFPRKALGFLFPFNDAEGVIAYLAAMRAGHAIVTLNPTLDPALTSRLIARFRPDFLIAPSSHPPVGPDYTEAECPHPAQLLLRLRESEERSIHADLALLLSTSGSTGSPKLVRLSYGNLASNAAQILDATSAGSDECALVTSPIFNGFGQSMIHTALCSGGSFVLSRARVVTREFWDAVRDSECNAVGGTPYFYEALDRLDLDSLDVPRLARFIQSGGRLAEHLAVKFHRIVAARGGVLHLMYGQAEATARITGLPPRFLPEAARSVGSVLRGGSLWVERDGQRCQPMEEGEFIYAGPNVMLGYANCVADLALGDVQGGKVATGDLGYHDSRGLFYITGRRTRFAKVFGWRISLDDIEELLSPTARVAAVSEDGRVVVYSEEGGPDLAASVQQMAGTLGLHPCGFEIRTIVAIPRLANGKIDYRSLEVPVVAEQTAER